MLIGLIPYGWVVFMSVREDYWAPSAGMPMPVSSETLRTSPARLRFMTIP